MSAEELLREGRLDECLVALQEAVRKAPAEPKLRVFLFQLLAVLGQWERAVNQLKVAGGMDASALPMAQAYREAVRCEVLRSEVFAGRRSALVFGDPSPWIAHLVEAFKLAADGQVSASEQARARAFDMAPATAGRIDGQPFEWIADADPRLGPVLEALVEGRYYWIPFDRVRRIDVEAPADLRDVVWTPAHFVWANGGDSVGFIPTRYPGSSSEADAGLRLARRTEWRCIGGELHIGLGQRLLATDAGEYPLMDVRCIELDTIDAGSAVAEGADA